jgi:hypothetical protein
MKKLFNLIFTPKAIKIIDKLEEGQELSNKEKRQLLQFMEKLHNKKYDIHIAKTRFLFGFTRDIRCLDYKLEVEINHLAQVCHAIRKDLDGKEPFTKEKWNQLKDAYVRNAQITEGG